MWKKIDVSQTAAGIALTIKVIQFIGDSSGWAKDHPTLFSTLSPLSLILFAISLVIWLHSSQKQMAKVDKIAERVEDIKSELDRVDRIARYGSGGVWLAKLLGPDSQWQRLAHCHAGGVTLSNLLLDVYTSAAEDFHRLTSRNATEIKLVEYHVVDKFLLNLMKALPPGSIWLGVSRLQSSDAWERLSAEPAYIEFQEMVERRSRERTIQLLRLLCFEDAEHRSRMAPVITQQINAGLRLRVLVSTDLPEDMSLIWVPKSDASKKTAPALNADSPFVDLNNREVYQPLCAIAFQTRAGKDLDGMTLYSPESDGFGRLRAEFSVSWTKATPVAA